MSDSKKPNGGPKPKPEKVAPAESNGHPIATLLRAEGKYREGLRITTDPSRPSDPEGREPIRVDAGRFDAWAKSGAFERIEKPPEKEAPPAAPLAPIDPLATPPITGEEE